MMDHSQRWFAFLVLVSLILLVPRAAEARSFYVDFSKGKDGNAGTSAASPWKRCPGDPSFAGKGTLRAADVVYFKRGITYRGTIESISPSVTYTVGQWGTGDAVIDGSGFEACIRVGHKGIRISGGEGKNLVLTGKTVRHAAIWTWSETGLSGSSFRSLRIVDIGGPSSVEGIGIKIGGNPAAYHSFDIADNYIENCYSAGIKISGRGTRDIDIHHNILDGNGMLPAERCQVNLSSNDGMGVQEVRFHHNTVRNGPSKVNGINCNNANNEISHNMILANGGNGISLSMDYNRNYSGLTRVSENIITGNRGGYGIIMGGSDRLRRAFVYNNVLVDNEWYDINITEGSGHNEVYNNTIRHNRPGHGIRIQKGCDQNILSNNIVWTKGGFAIHDSSGTVKEDFNVLWRESGGATLVWKDRIYRTLSAYRGESGQGDHSLWEDPLLADSTSLRPGPRSPCIGTGINLSSLFSSDRNGIARPKEGGWDRGAYQSER